MLQKCTSAKDYRDLKFQLKSFGIFNYARRSSSDNQQQNKSQKSYRTSLINVTDRRGPVDYIYFEVLVAYTIVAEELGVKNCKERDIFEEPEVEIVSRRSQGKCLI